MKTDLVIASIQTIQTGLQMLIDAIEGEGIQDVKALKDEVKEQAESAKEVYMDGVEITQEFLETVKYNDLKKLASSLNLDGKGTRDQLIARILEADVETAEEEESNVVDLSKARKAKASKESVEEQADEETEEEKPEWVLNLEAMTTEELADLLSSVKLPAKGKHQALLDRAIAGVNDGTIVVVDDEEEEVIEEKPAKAKRQPKAKTKAVEATIDKEELITSELYAIAKSLLDKGESFSDYDVELDQETLDLVNRFSSTDLAMKDLNEADVAVVTEIATCAMLLMTDEKGDLQEFEEAYQLPTEQWFCCGHELEEKEEGMFCEVCGTTWE